MTQRVKFKIVIYTLIFLILAALLSFWLYYAAGLFRDYRRAGDLAIWRNVLAQYYLDNGSYRVPNCDTGQTLSDCLAYQSGQVWINNIKDPLNSGNYRYLVGSLSDDDYEIDFSLEEGIGGLKPGQYVLTKEGIRK